MKAYCLKDWKAWKEICEFYNFDPYKGGILRVNENSGKYSNFKYIGDVPKETSHER